MMASQPPLTTTSVLAGASAVLEEAGYRRVDPGITKDWPSGASRVYEDPYSVAALIVFETWRDLSASWLAAQDALVALISNYFSRGDAKAWEGYLVLLTSSVRPSDAHLEASEIRRDTAHVRKLLATAEELSEPGGIERALLPLLPLPSEHPLAEERSPFDLLPQILSRRGISEEVVRAAIEAYQKQESVVERLHALTEAESDVE
jgi:hypothetical protein